MAANFIGLIYGATSGRIYAIINPDDDQELDNPRWLLLQVGLPLDAPEPERPPGLDPEVEVPPAIRREPLALLRMRRDEYMACTHHDQVQAFVTKTLRA